MKKRESVMRTLGAAVGIASVVAAALLLGVYSGLFTNGPNNTTQTSSSTTNSEIQGIVTGYVTVGPSQPVCSANMSCEVNMTGYSLVFTPSCQGSSSCQTQRAPLSPSGHYSILLPPGNYSVSGLYPACQWMGCSAAFPKMVTVQGGMQLVLNVEIDTGIR